MTSHDFAEPSSSILEAAEDGKCFDDAPESTEGAPTDDTYEVAETDTDGIDYPMAYDLPEYTVHQVAHDQAQPLPPAAYDPSAFASPVDYNASGYVSRMAHVPYPVASEFNTNQISYETPIAQPEYQYDASAMQMVYDYNYGWVYLQPVCYEGYGPIETSACAPTPDVEPELGVSEECVEEGSGLLPADAPMVFDQDYNVSSSVPCEDVASVVTDFSDRNGDIPTDLWKCEAEAGDLHDNDGVSRHMLNPEAAEWSPECGENAECPWQYYYVSVPCNYVVNYQEYAADKATGENSHDWNASDSTDWTVSHQLSNGMFDSPLAEEVVDDSEGMPLSFNGEGEEEVEWETNGPNWWASPSPPIPEAEEWVSQDGDWAKQNWAADAEGDEWFANGAEWEEPSGHSKDELASSSRSEFSTGKDLGKEIHKSGAIIMSLQDVENMQALNLEMPSHNTHWLQERRNRIERDQSKLRRRSFMKEITGDSSGNDSDSEATPTTSAGSDLHVRKSFPEAESCVETDESTVYPRKLLLQLRLPKVQSESCVRLRAVSQHKKKAEKRKRRERDYRYWERDDRYWDRQASSYSVSSWQSLSAPPAKRESLKRWKSGGHLEELKRNCQSLLNKICPENLTTIVSQLANLDMTDAKDIELVISLIFKKALLEPHYSQTYSDMVFSLQNKFPHFPNPDKSRYNDDVVSFTRVLVHTCQHEFELLRSEDITALDDVEHMARKKRCLAHMKLLGSLYLRTLLSHKVIKLVCEDLLCGKPPEHFLESAIALLQSLGYAFENEKGPEFADKTINKLNELIATGDYGKRIQFMVKDLLDLRANGWQQKQFEAKAGEAKTLKEVANSYNDKYAVAGARPEYILNEDSFADQLLLQMKEEKNLSSLFQKTFSELPEVRQEKICVIMTQKGLVDVAQPRRRARTECESKIRLCEGAMKQLNLNPEVLKSVSAQTRKAAAEYSAFPAVAAFCDRIEKMTIV